MDFNVTFQEGCDFVAQIVIDFESGFEGITSALKSAKKKGRDYAGNFEDGSSLRFQHLVHHIMQKDVFFRRHIWHFFHNSMSRRQGTAAESTILNTL
jgi:hypothetical protein